MASPHLVGLRAAHSNNHFNNILKWKGKKIHSGDIWTTTTWISQATPIRRYIYLPVSNCIFIIMSIYSPYLSLSLGSWAVCLLIFDRYYYFSCFYYSFIFIFVLLVLLVSLIRFKLFLLYSFIFYLPTNLT